VPTICKLNSIFCRWNKSTHDFHLRLATSSLVSGLCPSFSLTPSMSTCGNSSQQQLQMFVEEHLVKHKEEVTDVITFNKFALFPEKVTFEGKATCSFPDTELYHFPNCTFHVKYVRVIWTSSLLTKTNHIPPPSPNLETCDRE